MKINKTFTIILLLIFFIKDNSFAQTIDVNESTLKVSALGEEVLYYGFAEGDQMIFNFEEVSGKELKELEIIEMPSSSKFMDYKTKKIENKTININQTAIYKLRFYNSALSGRICKFKIQRIPASNTTKNFNTTVYYKKVIDTTRYTENERYLVKSDTTISEILNQVAKVHSQTNSSGNVTTTNCVLPPNTVAWSYYIGVDQVGQQAFQNATESFSKASSLASKIPGWGLLGAVALNLTPNIARLQAGEDIDFIILDNENLSLKYAGQRYRLYKQGKVINDYGKMLAPLQGNLNFYLSNDNALQGVEVTIKVSAVVVNQKWGTRPIEKFNTNSHQIMYLK
jgi:hypothetical protein